MRIPRTPLLVFAATALFGFQHTDPWRPVDLLDTSAAAVKFKAQPAEQPLVLQASFPALYKSARVTGAKYAGPGSTAVGIANLERQVKSVPTNRAILLYCGCCRLEKCPNIHSTFKKLHELEYSNVQVAKIPTNLHTDWADPGYPIEKGS